MIANRVTSFRADRVTLNSTRAPQPTIQPTTQPKPKVIRDSIDISFDDLGKSQLPSDGQAVLKSFGKEASLKAMWSNIRATAPQMEAKGTTLKANYYKDHEWSNFRLTGTQQTEHGELSVTSRYNQSDDGKPVKPSQELSFAVGGECSEDKIPSVLRKHWERSGAKSTETITREVEALLPSNGNVIKTNIYAGRVEDEKPFTSMNWTRTTDQGVDIRYSQSGTRSSANMELTPEQFEGGAVPKSVEAQLDQFGLNKGLFDTILSETGLQASKYRLGVLEEDGKRSLTFGLVLSDGTKDVGNMNRRFTDKMVEGKKVREVYHGGFHMDKELQGRGLGKKLLGNSFEMYKKAGVDEVCLEASMTVGGYAWGRYGFQLLDNEKNHKKLNEQVEGRLSELTLDNRTEKTVKSLLNSDNPKRIWALADLDKKVIRDGKETKLGKALLLGNRWNGRFDMHDAASQKRLNHYLSK